jgi:hypothetical protein
MARVLIVSKTKMRNNYVCVGGIDVDNKQSVRLLDKKGHHDLADTCPYHLREIWDIEYARHFQRPLPHWTEDVVVFAKQKLRNLKDDSVMLDVLNYLQFPVYEGNILNVFEGKLKHTDKNTLYISKDDVPQHSTCFWVCDKEMFRNYDVKVRYRYNDGTRGYNMSYVGFEENLMSIIPKGTLIRLSLAHWWSPDDTDDEERCFLQLSGWY